MRLNKTLTVSAVAIALLGLAIPVQAEPPPTVVSTQELVGRDTEGDDGYCPFPVHIEYVSHQRVTKTELHGRTVYRATGSAYATVTGNGNTVTYNVSGPGTQTVYADGSFTLDATGPNLLWTTVANSYEGVPQLSYTNGHVRVAVDPPDGIPLGEQTGLTTSYALTGSSIDVCDVLS